MLFNYITEKPVCSHNESCLQVLAYFISMIGYKIKLDQPGALRLRTAGPHNEGWS